MSERYRFTVDQLDGKRTVHTVELTSRVPTPAQRDDTEVIVRPDHTFVDEVVIGDWLHVEAMNRREYWMNVAGVTLWIQLRKDGSVKSVRTYAAGTYDEPWDGVQYTMNCGEEHGDDD